MALIRCVVEPSAKLPLSVCVWPAGGNMFNKNWSADMPTCLDFRRITLSESISTCTPS